MIVLAMARRRPTAAELEARERNRVKQAAYRDNQDKGLFFAGAWLNRVDVTELLVARGYLPRGIELDIEQIRRAWELFCQDLVKAARHGLFRQFVSGNGGGS